MRFKIGSAYTWSEICVSKSIGLAYSWKEIYVSNLQKGFTETALRMTFQKRIHTSTLSQYGQRESKSELRKKQ